jgi:hypothetical protein
LFTIYGAIFILPPTIVAMSRVFNIYFHHKGASYSALVTVSGNSENNPPVTVTSNEDAIRIVLPSGNLVIPIAELIQRLISNRQHDSGNATVYITNNISLQLLTQL